METSLVLAVLYAKYLAQIGHCRGFIDMLRKRAALSARRFARAVENVVVFDLAHAVSSWLRVRLRHLDVRPFVIHVRRNASCARRGGSRAAAAQNCIFA
eukprot:1469167-Pleurochrysis_carterae.AAC.3